MDRFPPDWIELDGVWNGLKLSLEMDGYIFIHFQELVINICNIR